MRKERLYRGTRFLWSSGVWKLRHQSLSPLCVGQKIPHLVNLYPLSLFFFPSFLYHRSTPFLVSIHFYHNFSIFAHPVFLFLSFIFIFVLFLLLCSSCSCSSSSFSSSVPHPLLLLISSISTLVFPPSILSPCLASYLLQPPPPTLSFIPASPTPPPPLPTFSLFPTPPLRHPPPPLPAPTRDNLN